MIENSELDELEHIYSQYCVGKSERDIIRLIHSLRDERDEHEITKRFLKKERLEHSLTIDVLIRARTELKSLSDEVSRRLTELARNQIKESL